MNQSLLLETSLSVRLSFLSLHSEHLTLGTKKGCIKSFLMEPYAFLGYVNNNLRILAVP